ncbi:MAG: peptidase MA family metallohydrolase [Myxococcales bacterium]
MRGNEFPERLPAGYTFESVGPVRWVFPNTAEAAVQRLQQSQQAGWATITEQLGHPISPHLDIRVGVNPEQMQALAPPGARLPEYATGVAFPSEGLIFLTLTEPSSFLRPDMERVLAHEMSHVAMHRAVNGQVVPRWFSEGVAIHQAGERSLARIRTLWDGALRGDLVPLAELSGAFPARHDDVNLAYAQSADLVRRMLDGEGDRLRFERLIAKLRDGTPFAQAFHGAYGVTLDRFEQRWTAELRHRFGRWPSLLMGLTGVWAIAAGLLVVGYVRTRRRHHATLRRWAIEEAPLLNDELADTKPATPDPPPSTADRIMDAVAQRDRTDSNVPKVIHEGRSYTLH